MSKNKSKLNLNRRNFLTGTATLAGIAATASVVPITIANANHNEGKKGLPDFIPGISPVEKWACGYCDFKDHCNPPDYKNKVR